MDEFAKITAAERQILKELRTLRPSERITIVADRDGKPHTFFVERQTKFMLKVEETVYFTPKSQSAII